MGGPSSLLGSPSARSTHEDDRTTRPHCWCLQEEGRLILKGALCMDILPSGAVTLSPSRSRGLCLRFRYFSLQRIYHRAILLQNLLLRRKKSFLKNWHHHRYTLVLFQVVLGMKLD